MRAVDKHRHLIEEALAIADDSVHGRSKPTLKADDAAGLVFAFLMMGWPKAKVIADLEALQTGVDREGGNSPIFVAADQLQKDSQKAEPSSLTGRYGAIVRAFQLHEQGFKAIRISEIRNAMKRKNLPAPVFPGTGRESTVAA